MERIGTVLDKHLGRIQMEMDLTNGRLERLSGDDSFNVQASQRPVPSTQDDKDPTKQKRLYDEIEDKVSH